jgi:hypothetical protein
LGKYGNAYKAEANDYERYSHKNESIGEQGTNHLVTEFTQVQVLPLTAVGLAKVAIFTTNADAENQTLINHKCVCGALNRQFLVGAVMRSYIFTKAHP